KEQKEPINISKEEVLLKKKKIKAAKYEQYRLQKWDEVYTGLKKKIVIFRNVFSYEDALNHDAGDSFYDFIKKLIEMKHPYGIVCIKLKTVEDAEIIVSCFNNVELNNKKLDVYFYDGKQDLKAQCLPAKSNPKLDNGGKTKIITDNKDFPSSILLNTNLESFH
ncbi:hypothetical protein HEP_00490500, partial [Hepatocystis sp. ex Piliocolobus tephrosceles]